jgi:hypothetical protein
MVTELWDNYGIKVVRVTLKKSYKNYYRITVGGCSVDLTGQEFKIFMTETLAAAKHR